MRRGKEQTARTCCSTGDYQRASERVERCGAGRDEGAPLSRPGEGGLRHSRPPSTLCNVASKHTQDAQPTFVMMVPASRVVVLKDLGRTPGLKNVVHLVLLSPSQRLTHDLSGFVDIEVPGA